jgi:major vault protein
MTPFRNIYIFNNESISILATLRAQAAKIEADIELYRLTQARELELSYSKLVSDLEIEKAKRLADIETAEFKEHVNAIGAKTIQAIATSGSDNQVSFIFLFLIIN